MTCSEILQVAKPILFNAEMVRAILDGRKTVTRRAVKPQHLRVLDSPYHKEHPEVPDKVLIEKLCKPPYEPGCCLYVRETWGCYERYWWEAGYYLYRSDYPNGAKTYLFNGDSNIVCDLPKWHPSIHMPKEAARIFLRVTDVRVERLKEIENGWQFDKEGIVFEHGFISEAWRDFQRLWDSAIKPKDRDKYGWAANPYVWVIEFERVEVEQ